jgi:hypothetical protein
MTHKRTPVPAEFGGQPEAPAATPANHGGASEPQLKFINDLRRKRELTGDQLAKFDARLAQLKEAGELTMRKASEIIDWLKPLPARVTPLADATPATTAPRADDPVVVYEEAEDDKGDVKRVGTIVMPDGTRVPVGSYGVDTSANPTFTNDTTFFRVWINEDYGKGWGVQMYVSDDTTRVKLRVPVQIEAMREIAKDPLAAASLFGHEFKRCGICSRGLTNDESRERGIGPVCARRFAL